jgi:hypothetical protein
MCDVYKLIHGVDFFICDQFFVIKIDNAFGIPWVHCCNGWHLQKTYTLININYNA